MGIPCIHDGIILTGEIMDIAAVEGQYNRLQQEAKTASQALQKLASKLKTSADSGNADARDSAISNIHAS